MLPLLLAAYIPADRVELRPTEAKPSAGFFTSPGKARRMFVNGNPTSLVVPRGYDLNVRCRNSSGRVGASLSFYSPGIVWQNEGVGLWPTSKNGVEIIPVWPVAMDDSGRAVDIAGASGMNPGLDDPYDPLVARLWDGHKLTVLGPAVAVRFGRSGAIEGYAVTDPEGKPVHLQIALREEIFESGSERFLPFQWWNEVRTEDKLLTRPPF